MSQFFAVTRSFQQGLTFADLDESKRSRIDLGVVRPIETLLRQAPTAGFGGDSFAGLIVVTCADSGSAYSEEERGGDTPTTSFLRSRLVGLVEPEKLHFHLCRRWGLNRGSTTALNEGIALGQQLWRDASQVLCWSPEFSLEGPGGRSRVAAMLGAMATSPEAHVVGYAREAWNNGKKNLRFPQNTCAFWRLDSLARLGGFDERCNGRQGEQVPGQGSLLAGMEDFHAYLRLCKLANPATFGAEAWGLAGKDDPAAVELKHKTPEQGRAQAEKAARQEGVMATYVAEIFDGRTIEDLWAQIEASDVVPSSR